MPIWIVIDAPVSVTLTRAQNDPPRGISRNPKFHRAAHRRFRDLMPSIPADANFDSSAHSADDIAAAIEHALLTIRESPC